MAIETELLDFVRESLLRGSRNVAPEDSLIELGVIDSVGLMHLMSFIEESTGTRIPDHLITPDNFRSVAAMTSMLEELESRERP